MTVEYRIGFEAISPMSIEELSRKFYARFDGQLAEHCGRINVFVYVEGENAYQAAVSTIPNLEKLGFSIVSTDRDFVDGPQIAERLGVTRQAVQNWAKGTRSASFPHPVGFPGGRRIWAWAEVVEWARRERRTDEPLGLDPEAATMVDAMLVRRRQSVAPATAHTLGSMLVPGSAKAQAGTSGLEDYPNRPRRSVG